MSYQRWIENGVLKEKIDVRIAGYALTNAAGHAVSVSFAYDGSRTTGLTYTIGGTTPATLTLALTRDAGRPELVTRRDYAFNNSPVYWHETSYDVLGRPTGANDGGDCKCSRFAGRVGTPCRPRRSRGDRPTGFGNCRYGYTNDMIGNRLTATENSATLIYTANALNQYTSIASATRIGDRCLTSVASSVEPVYDADGNLIEDDRFEYVYDDENRLVSAYPISPAANDLAVENFYDHLHRRIQKTVYQYVNNEWELDATHTFVWDGMNIVLERIAYANNMTRTCEYYWGPDRSGTEQGAGGVEGLLAVSIDGTFYFPLYGDNANIVGYISETGTLAAQYVYGPYGNIIETYGPSPNLFAFGFSTKYHDRELDLIAYQRRYYNPEHGRWLNRDPIQEQGGINLYGSFTNDPIGSIDADGCAVYLLLGGLEDTSNPMFPKQMEAMGKCLRRVLSFLVEFGKISESQFECLKRKGKVFFNGEVFTGSYVDYKLNVQHELDSRVLVRRSYEECFNEMQYLAMQPRKSYGYLVFLAHGARRFVNGKLERTILTFSDGVYDQHAALNEIAGLMVPSMGEHVIVSCFQTWNLKDTNKHFETFRLFFPRWTIKVAGSEGSVSFSPIKVEKVVL